MSETENIKIHCQKRCDGNSTQISLCLGALSVPCGAFSRRWPHSAVQLLGRVKALQARYTKKAHLIAEVHPFEESIQLAILEEPRKRKNRKLEEQKEATIENPFPPSVFSSFFPICGLFILLFSELFCVFLLWLAGAIPIFGLLVQCHNFQTVNLKPQK